MRRCGLREGKSVVVLVVVEGVRDGGVLELRCRRLGMGLEVR